MSDTATPDTTAKAEKTGQATMYVILQKSADTWKPTERTAGGVEARSADEAIRKAVAREPLGEQSGTFVAIPERSFRPVTVTPQTKTTLELKPAS